MKVIHHLQIAHVEMRCENDAELAAYRHERLVETIICDQQSTSKSAVFKDQINELLSVPLKVLFNNHILDTGEVTHLNLFCIQDGDRFVGNAYK